MPEGERKIDYHLMTRDHIVAACLADVGSCELGATLQIATDAPLFQHELIHAYMQLAAPGAEPMPFIAEGTAQAIGCYALPWRVNPMDEVPSWQEAIVSDALGIRPGRDVCAVLDPDAGDRCIRALLPAGAGASRSGAVRGELLGILEHQHR